MFLPRRIPLYFSASIFTHILLYSTPNLIFNASHNRHLLGHSCDACSLTTLLLVFILIVDSGIVADTGAVQSRYWINEDKLKRVSTNQLQLWPNIVSVNILSKSLLYLMTCEVREQAYKIIAVTMSSHNHTQNLHNIYSLWTSFFWDVSHRLVVVFRRFRTTYQLHLQISTYAALRSRRAKAEMQVWNLETAFCWLKCWITHFFALSSWHFGQHAHYLHMLSEVFLRSPGKYQGRT